jgi:Protein of unknown function (DUF429)
LKKRIFGLDFSGARDAGRRIWLAEGRLSPDGLEILECLPAVELPGGGIERSAAISAVGRAISNMRNAIIGCDFPFSLPRDFIRAESWIDFIAGFDHLDAFAFRAHCRRFSAGREPKRQTDLEAKTPWCAFNIRLYRQSFHGMAELLKPLVVEAKAAIVLPMQPTRAGRPWLIEVCPASALRHFGWRGSYKGPQLRSQRRRILALLSEARLLKALPSSIAERAIDNSGGDALDSIIAALATARALRELGRGAPIEGCLEGQVFFKL